MFHTKGFDVLAFPCNQFGLQEPGNNATEILNGLKYVRPGSGFVPKFQMMAKIEVNGKNEQPLYTYLKKYCDQTVKTFKDVSTLFYAPLKEGDVFWNFEAYLISKKGQTVKRYHPTYLPLEMIPDIKKELEKC